MSVCPIPDGEPLDPAAGNDAPKILIVAHRTIWNRALELPPTLPDGYEITENRNRLREADVVVFHIPETRFYHLSRKPRGQIWVAWAIESDVNYPRLRDESFMARFDLTMTYRRDADVLWGYIPYYGSADMMQDALKSPPLAKDSERPVAMLISSATDKCGRREYAEELARHIPIDSYGKFLRNRTLPDDRWRSSKLEVIAHYPFTIAFENSITRDYVTEKYYDPLVAGSVPIYMGAPNASEFRPGERCYIDVRDFSEPRALAGYLHELLRDERKYDEYLAWKRLPLRPEFIEFLDGQRTHPWVRLCEAVGRLRATWRE
jgi:hypothetical protein